jgi:hypothetical protein
VPAIGPVLRVAAALVACALLVTTTLGAQATTGTIEGYVTDGSGEPAAAVVVVVGISHRTTTGDDGFYRLTYVPAGSRTLRIEPPNSDAFAVADVLVMGGEVRRVDVDLASRTALQDPVGPVPAPLASAGFVTGSDVDRLPIGDPVDVLRYQAGVTSGRADALVVRGSRPSDQTLFVDGVPVRSMYNGLAPLGVAPNTLTEVSAGTGPLGSSWGDAQAGAVTLVTAGAPDKLAGAVAYESDLLQGTGSRAGFQWIEASVGGRPIERLELFAGGIATTRQAAELQDGIQDLPVYTYGPPDTVLMLPSGGAQPDTVPFVIPQIVQYGGTCDRTSSDSLSDSLALCFGRRRPRAWNSDSRWNARARYDLGGGSAVTLSALTQARQSIDWTGTMHEEGRPGLRAMYASPATVPGIPSPSAAWRTTSTTAPSRTTPTRPPAPRLPNKGQVLQRYYGWYSSRQRGMRRRAHGDAGEQPVTLVEPEPEAVREAKRRWAELLRRIFEVDPLACPRCGTAMRIVAFITEPSTIDHILEHLRRRPHASRQRQRAPPRRWKSKAGTTST